MDSFYGGQPGISFIIVEQYDSVEAMLNAFAKGSSYENVKYGEYVIIDTVMNLNNKRSLENGLVYCRGFNYQEPFAEVPDRKNYSVQSEYELAMRKYFQGPGAGAVYVGQIAGPQGEAPYLQFMPESEVKALEDEYQGTGKIDIVSGETHDNITYSYCNIKDKDGNYAGCVLGFTFPYHVIKIHGESISPYDEKGHYDESQKQWTYSDLIEKESGNDDSKPFYSMWKLLVPKGIHGTDLSSIGIDDVTKEYYYVTKDYNTAEAGVTERHNMGFYYKVIKDITFNKETAEYIVTYTNGDQDKISASYLYGFVEEAEQSANTSKDWADKSKSYAVGTDGVIRPEDVTDNAKSYYEKIKQYVEGFEGIIYIDSINFADLDTVEKRTNYMYNIKDEFTSDERFTDGGGVQYDKGSNVIWTKSELWDVTAASGVFGIKGNAEEDYKQGRYEITPDKVQLPDNFAAAVDRARIEPGDSLSTAFSKLAKYCETIESNEKKTPIFGSYATFPHPGETGRLYVDETEDPRLIFTWNEELQDYVLTGGAGGEGSSADIPITLLASDWSDEFPYSQTLTVPQVREGLTPIHFLATNADDNMIYAYSLITDYAVGLGEITFYASAKPAVDIDIILKGVPAQELDTPDNTVIVPVEADGWNLDRVTERYVKQITVDGMKAGTGGHWDIVRKGGVITREESEIALSITDIERLDGAIKIYCLKEPKSAFTVVLFGTYKEAIEGDVLVSGLSGLVEKVNTLDESAFTDDTANNITTFESVDTNDNEQITEWTNTPVLVSEEKHSSIFNKMSTMFKNIRYLHKMLEELSSSQTKMHIIITNTQIDKDINIPELLSAVQSHYDSMENGESHRIWIKSGRWLFGHIFRGDNLYGTCIINTYTKDSGPVVYGASFYNGKISNFKEIYPISFEKLNYPLKFIVSMDGIFSNLLNQGSTAFIVAQRVSAYDGIALIANRYNDTIYTKIITKDDSITVETDDAQGTIQIKYADSSNGVYAFAAVWGFSA